MQNLSNFSISWHRWLIVIPARLASTRLPEKPLIKIGDLPMVVKTFMTVKPLLEMGAQVYVATDSDKIIDLCKNYQVPAQMTSVAHNSGTDRCNEVAQRAACDFVLNLQGDEPFMSTEDICRLCVALESNDQIDIATLAYRSSNIEDMNNPNVVKAIQNRTNRAIYFSRSPIPHYRDPSPQTPISFWHHLGIYAFKKQSLKRFCELPASHLESTEKLEQLRAIENFMYIHLEASQHLSRGIDTPEDLKRISK